MSGNDVVWLPEEKIRSRYDKALALIPKFVEICDILHIYDNTQEPFRIFKKRKDVYYRWSNQYWSNDDIKKLSRNFLNLGIIESRNYIRISYGSFLYAGTNGISPFS